MVLLSMLLKKKNVKETARIAKISSVRHGSCNHHLLSFFKGYNRIQLGDLCGEMVHRLRDITLLLTSQIGKMQLLTV